MAMNSKRCCWSLLLVAAGVAATQTRLAADEIRVRGVVITDYQSWDSLRDIRDLYKPNPERPGTVERTTKTLSMPIYGAERHAVLHFPVAWGRFYVGVRENRRMRHYGPIAGDPFEVLALDEAMRGQLREAVEQPNDALLRLRQLISIGDEAQLRRGFSMMLELPPPNDRRTLRDVTEIAAEMLAELDSGPLQALGKRALAHVRQLTAIAEADWEKRRVLLDDDEYTAGETDELPGDIVWGEAADNGLQLGVRLSGTTASGAFQAGESHPLELHVRHVGGTPVRFTTTSRIDEGVSIWLIDAMGERHAYGIAFFTSLLQPERYRLEESQWRLVKAVPLVVRRLPPGEEPPRSVSGFLLPAGTYQLEVELTIPGFESWREGEVIVPAAGDWTGTLNCRLDGLTIE